MKRSFIKSVTSFFAILFIVFIPFPYSLVNAQPVITDFIFGSLISFTSGIFLDKPIAVTNVYSDSISMYMLVLLLFILSTILSLILLPFKKWNECKSKVFSFLYSLFIYFLALQLLKYGADKLFKNQFYLPEPNTLYTPLGMLDSDLAYWSSMGTSKSYSIFLGILETGAGFLLLLKRTRLIGLLVSFGIIINIVAVNFGFDISVKLFSLFLLYLTLYLLSPYGKQLYQLLVLQRNSQEPAISRKTLFLKDRFLYFFLKWLVVSLILVEVFYPFIRAGNFNSNSAERPYLHGAYEVQQVISGTDTLPVEKSPVKKFFIHKDSYLIFQDQQDAMQDYKLSVDKAASVFILTDYQLKQTILSFSYNPSDSTLLLNYQRNGAATKLVGKAVDWKKLPLLRKGFHWTVDEQ